jgi:hypothetical protein
MSTETAVDLGDLGANCTDHSRTKSVYLLVWPDDTRTIEGVRRKYATRDSDDAVVIPETEVIIKRTVSEALRAQQVTLADSTVLTLAQVEEAITKFMDLFAGEDGV